MKLGIALVIVAILAWYVLRPSAGTPDQRSTVSDPATASRRSPSAGSATKPPDHVREISSLERAELERQIAHAHSMHASRPPSLPKLDSSDADDFKTTLRAAVKEAIPFITKCYEDHLLGTNLTVKTRMELTGDPDIGTLIDAQPIPDVPAAFDDCMRDALQHLELPPLVEGDHVIVDYPFTFRSI